MEGGGGGINSIQVFGRSFHFLSMTFLMSFLLEVDFSPFHVVRAIRSSGLLITQTAGPSWIPWILIIQIHSNQTTIQPNNIKIKITKLIELNNEIW